MEIGYSAVSHANPMIQLADVVAFTMKRWAMSQGGYRKSLRLDCSAVPQAMS
jgi:hypothetical protein